MSVLTFISRSTPTRRLALWGLFCLTWPLVAPVRSAPPEDPATRHETWVPAADLQAILKQHPNAVVLDRPQYEALLRDAGKLSAPTAKAPPVPGVIEGVASRVVVTGGVSWVTMESKIQLRNLADGWVDHPLLPFPAGTRLTKIDGQEATLRAGNAPILAVKGLGKHTVTLEFAVEAHRDRAIGQADLPLVASPYALTIETHGDVQLPAGWPVKNGLASPTVTNLPLGPSGPPSFWLFTWTETPPASSPASIWQNATCVTRLDDSQVITQAKLHVETTQGPLPDHLEFNLPKDSNIISLDETGVAAWSQQGSTLKIERSPRTRTTDEFQVTLTRPLPSTDGVTPLEVDVPRLQGASRVSAHLVVSVGSHFELTGWVTPPDSEDNALRALASETAHKMPVTAAAYYQVTPEHILAKVRRFVDRFSADVDTRAAITAHDVTITRSIAFHGEEGRPLRTRLVLPEGEQFLDLTPKSGISAVWKKLTARDFEISWQEGLLKGRDTVLTLATRKNVSLDASQGKTPDHLALQNLQIPAAARVAGYVTLAFDSSWQVTTSTTQGLEARDSRLTPIGGNMAWFGLRDYHLEANFIRRESIVDVSVLAYALPRARTVEIEGQFNLRSSVAPLRQLQVKLDPSVAKWLHVESPLIGGKSLDEATGVWTLHLREELLGEAAIRWNLSVTSEPEEHSKSGRDKPDDAVPAQAEHSTPPVVTSLPRFSVPQARHFSGLWVIEANTDTELSYHTKGVQPFDPVQAPSVQSYTPRHRVIAAYQYGSGEYELRVTATRHHPSTLTSAVVQALDLTSIFSADGSSRHEAKLRVQHNGMQFFTLRLPNHATLLSASVNGNYVKPVRAIGADDEVKLPLPSLNTGSNALELTLLYELDRDAWGPSGTAQAPTPVFDASVPVLASRWQVYSPTDTEWAPPSGWKVLTARQVPTFAEQYESWSHPKHGGGLDGEVDFLPGGVQPTLADEPLVSTLLKFQEIILPEIDLNGATLSEAAAQLTAQSIQGDPLHRGVQFHAPAAEFGPRIHLSAKNIPLTLATAYVSRGAKVSYEVTADRVNFLNSRTGPAFIAKVWRLHYDFLNQVPAANDGSSSAPAGINLQRTAAQVLTDCGIPLPPTSQVKWDASCGLLLVTTTRESMNRVEEFIENFSPGGGFPPTLTSSQRDDLWARRIMKQALDKWQNVIIPRVQYQGKTIQEAVDDLNRQIRTLAKKTPDVPIPLIAINPIYEPATTASISLDLRQVPLIEALRYVTELAGMKYRITPYAIDIMPPTDTTTEQFTRLYRVPPDFIHLLRVLTREQSSDNAPLAPSVKQALQLAGIQFPEGSSASYLSESSQLIVHNTQPMLDQVESIIDQLGASQLMLTAAPNAKAGLISLPMALPRNGQLTVLERLQEPQPFVIHYRTWQRQLAIACFCLVLGFLAFTLLGRFAPWLSTLLIGAGLICLPLAWLPSWMAVCNSLIVGWLIGLVVWLLWSAARWWETKRQHSGRMTLQ